MFDTLSNGDLLDLIAERQCTERVAVAERLLAVGRFALRRLEELGDEHGNWCVDDWEAVAAEVGVQLRIGRGRASTQMHYGKALLERLPKLAAVCLTGQVDMRMIGTIIFRTALIVDPAAKARIDGLIAARASRWNRLSDNKLIAALDWLVIQEDPDALRVARERTNERHLEVQPDGSGMADIWGSVCASDGAVFDKSLDALADTVCREDPRTRRQRRADALPVLATRGTSLPCRCGSEACPANEPQEATTGAAVVVQVIAEAATVEGTSDKPALLPGYGPLPAQQVRELVTRARLRAITAPAQEPEPGYRPSAGLAAFIRCRDLTCRWPQCDRPAEHCDIDHTVPWPIGPTHPSKLRCC